MKTNDKIVGIVLALVFITLTNTAKSQGTNQADSLRQLLKKETNDTLRTDLKTKISRVYWYNEPLQARKWGIEALKDAMRQNYAKGIAQAANVTGVAYDILGKPDSAVYYYDLAIKQSQTPRLLVTQASALNNKGMIYQSLGRYTEAIEHYHKALDIFTTIKNKAMIANTFNNLGLTYDELKQFERAEEYHRKALKIRKEINDLPGTAASLNNLALIFQEKCEYNESLKYLFEAEEIRKKQKDHYGLGIVYNNIAEIYALLKNYPNVIKFSRRSLQERKLAGDEGNNSYTYHNLTNAYLKLGNPKMARLYLDSAFYVLGPQPALPRLIKSWEMKIAWLKATGKMDSLVKAYEIYVSLKDSLEKNILEQQIATSEANFGLAQKKAEILKLEQENKIKNLAVENERARRKNQQLYGLLLLGGLLSVFGAIVAHLRYRSKVNLEKEKRMLQEKVFIEVMAAEDRERQRIAMELHDGLGQLLSAALLHIRAISTQDPTKDTSPAKNAEKVVQTAVDEMRRTSRNLMPGALVRKGLIKAIEEIIEGIQASGKYQINFYPNAQLEKLNLQTQHTIYRVIQETLNNIIKHANADIIDIEIAENNNHLTLVIKDNGSTKAMPNLQQGQGIGMISIARRIELLKGKYAFTKNHKEGNIFSLEFKLQEA